TRQDFIDDTPQARAAIERLGPLPEAILSGKLRSSFSSPLPGKTKNPGVTDDK
ncbi:AcaB family transcriptional regulator, partial [Salmonella enterica]